MSILQIMPFADRFPHIVGNTLTSSGVTDPLTFSYPADTRDGDLLIAYIVSENKVVPVLPSGWTSVYANAVTSANGSNSGRLLMSKVRYGTDTSQNVTVTPGGGNCICISIRDYANANSINVSTEIGLNGTVGANTKNVAYTGIRRTRMFVVMANEDGAVSDPTISITGNNVTQSVSSVPGDRRSMGLGLVTSTGNTVSGNVTINLGPLTGVTANDGVYAIGFTIE